MHLPDYKGNSIVNLMSSISRARGYNSPYKPLKSLSPKEIEKKKNIILIVVDGMGNEFLRKYCKGSFIEKNIRSMITSVFPSTTASAIPTFRTGLEPAQHGLVGWFMYFKELGVVGCPLRFSLRCGGTLDFDPELIFDKKSIFEKMKTDSYLILPKNIVESDFTYSYGTGAKKKSYSTLHGMSNQIMKSVHESKKKKYIYAYWPIFDSLSHVYGCNHKIVKEHFEEIDDEMLRLSKRLKGTDSRLLITADHGQVISKKSEMINLEKHPKLKEMLITPLTGEPRVVFCHLKMGMEKRFVAYIKKHLGKYCDIVKSKTLIKKKFFGIKNPDKRLADRVGDYTLILKRNYIIQDKMITSTMHTPKGNHGGVSAEEMYVPLISIDFPKK